MPIGIRRWLAPAALAAVAALTTSPLASADDPPPATEPLEIAPKDFTVTSSLDGITLEARLYEPTIEGAYPVVLLPHGGGSNVDSEWDARRAQDFARAGFVAVVWSARGHGNSGGFYDLFGPKTVQDTEDVLHAVASVADHEDMERVGITGYSQGGGTTNMAAAFDGDEPGDIDIDLIGPGNTFSGLEESLIPNGCLKTTVDGVILGAAYQAQGARLDPDLVARWTAYALTGVGKEQVLAEWDARAPRLKAAQIDEPSLWVQAFDDPLFPVDQALTMDELRGQGSPNHLYLGWAGHFATPVPEVEADREVAHLRWFQHWLQGVDNHVEDEPRVTWWDKTATGGFAKRQSATWPPPGTEQVPVDIAPATVAQAGGGQGVADDPVLAWGADQPPVKLGSTLRSLPNHTPAETLVAVSPAASASRIYAGSAEATLTVAPTGGSDQVDVKVWSVAPGGAATLLSRGCTALPPGAGPRQVLVDLWDDAVEVPAGNTIEVWVQAADAPMFRPPRTPGTLQVSGTVTLPLLAEGS